MDEKILVGILGLGLFLFGIHLMSDGLKKVVGEKMKLIINKAVKNPIIAILIGFLVTTLIQSSSGTTVLVVSLITAGLLPLSSGCFIILGANIGSPTTSILIGLNITKYSPILVIIGAIMIFFFNNHKKVRRIGRVIIGLGLMFYGLECLGTALKSIKDSEFFTSMLGMMDKAPILALLIGFALTCIVQSSGATIGIVQQLYMANSDGISLKIIIAFILGANIGTIITGLIASLKSSRDAKRLIVFDYFFNITNAILFMALLYPLSNLYGLIENSLFTSNHSGMVSFIAMSIKIVGVLLIGGFTPLIIKLLYKIIKPTEEEKLSGNNLMLDANLAKTSPALALECAFEKISVMKDIVKEMYDNATKFMFTKDEKFSNKVNSLEEVCDNYYESLHDYLTRIPSNVINKEASLKKTFYLDSVKDLERIADHCTNLIERMDERYEVKISFNEMATTTLNNMIELVQEMMNKTFASIEKFDKELAQEALSFEEKIDANEKNSRALFLEHQIHSEDTKADLNIVEILSNFERIGDHLTNISEHIIKS